MTSMKLLASSIPGMVEEKSVSSSRARPVRPAAEMEQCAGVASFLMPGYYELTTTVPVELWIILISSK